MRKDYFWLHGLGWNGSIGFFKVRKMFEFWRDTWGVFFLTFVFCSTSGKAMCEGNAHMTTCPKKNGVMMHHVTKLQQ